MLVTRHSLAHELLALNLITRAAIVDGGFRVRERLGRNRVYAVSVSDQPRYLVKQSLPSGTAWQRKTITAEARCLEFARADEALRPHFPELIHINHQHQFIIQEFVAEKHFADLKQEPLADRIALAREFGSTLALIHRKMQPLFANADDHENTTRPAWILSPHRIWYPKQLSKNSPLVGFAAVLKQFPEIDQALDATSDLWQRNAWIHHDIKTSNCLWVPGADAEPRVVIVDWELARLGDTAWDLAGMMHSYIGDAIIRRDQTRASEKPSDDDEDLSLDAAAKVTSAMCAAYVSKAALSTGERGDFLHRCLRYTGARLIQLASESQSNSRRATSFALLLLQAGLNLMQNPDAFAELVDVQSA